MAISLCQEFRKIKFFNKHDPKKWQRYLHLPGSAMLKIILIDASWFGRKDVFNTEAKNSHNSLDWETNNDIVTFPNGKTWKDYISDTRLEMACGESSLTSQADMMAQLAYLFLSKIELEFWIENLG